MTTQRKAFDGFLERLGLRSRSGQDRPDDDVQLTKPEQHRIEVKDGQAAEVATRPIETQVKADYHKDLDVRRKPVTRRDPSNRPRKIRRGPMTKKRISYRSSSKPRSSAKVPEAKSRAGLARPGMARSGMGGRGGRRIDRKMAGSTTRAKSARPVKPVRRSAM